MSTRQKSARRIAAAGAFSFSRDTVCLACRCESAVSRQTRRHAATAAATVETPATGPSQPQSNHIPPVNAKSTAPAKAYALLAAPVLSRPPLLTRELTSFEKAFYLYQKRLNERLSLPFSRYFYDKSDTPTDREWKRKVKGRGTAARDIGVYSGYGSEAWNDEVKVGSRIAEPDTTVEALIRDAGGKSIVEDEVTEEKSPNGESTGGETQMAADAGRRELTRAEVERPMPKRTEADRTNDQKSLSRKLDRTLYLLVKNKEGRWRFPEDRVYGRENLHQAAERILIQACGINMNTWLVGNHPIGHYAFNYPPLPNSPPHSGRVTTIPSNRLVSTSRPDIQREEFGEKVFFMKARIMAGQVELAKNEYEDQDFVWLAKDEMQSFVTEKYWSAVRNMLSER